ncbi:MAG: PTS glucose transporter subunit IIA [Carnobacterium sp.]|jgi:glucose-specific phosphotransferase system IIA component|uniref:PTS glucose transporter subunit IIA n=1 Tax=Carnobacterium maltaromaticum TaxID=2751 RepID=A0AAW9JSN9_CARML|nr:PTS glucose transporter subunit IIA [Carnobacterium maltaromaticum]AOA03541.1 PTS sugar transporter subunit IIABC [Carnobacterium maltaromaticum]KRN73066.1 phosphotransferase enzyme IIA component YpqE [Carnobacterium maltaromaticum]KRN86294.1 phosphotransferase enzyme IIA component YpqE [Carnobacterium maltaromaticum]MBC9789420.1 PTS glucose transporter subunit IIA [Carnobacterium maltaromaticum]MBC9808853.1 PTS glucose transporter subunit IIA [Carnobacterium maltaromaticum]
MGLFFNKKKKEEAVASLYEELVAVADGKVLPISEVPDPVFAEKMMGEGFAIDPTSDVIVSPISGTLVQVADTLHAYGIQSDSGVEVLVHVGLDTVNLQGKGFEAKVKIGDAVKKGDPLVKIDREYLIANAPSIVIPVIVTNGNMEAYNYDFKGSGNAVAGETVAMVVSKA